MPNFSGLAVEEPRGPRWELALQLIESGEAPVQINGLEIQRDLATPNTDGTIHVSVQVGDGADRAQAESRLASARRTMADLISAQPDLARIFDRYGYCFDVVHDYGMGTVLRGHANPDSDLDWLE